MKWPALGVMLVATTVGAGVVEAASDFDATNCSPPELAQPGNHTIKVDVTEKSGARTQSPAQWVVQDATAWSVATAGEQWQHAAGQAIVGPWWSHDVMLIAWLVTKPESVRAISDNAMAGTRYVTLESNLPVHEGGLVRAQTSYSVTAAGVCRLLRSAVLGEDGKARKKVFFHWHEPDGALTSVHIEDAATLGRAVIEFGSP